MDKSAFRKHRILNTAQTALLMFGMSLLLGALGWFLGGATGVLLAVSGVFVSLMFAPSMSPRFILRLYNAQMLTSRDAPDLFAVLDSLARRAQLEREPELYYVPSPIINAFAVGSRDASAIALTAGLLQKLNVREITAVLAHELSHIRYNDMNVMGLADVFSRVTGLLSTTGQVLLVINLPLMLSGGRTISWIVILILLVAPLLSALIQRGLSRAREYDADLGAVELTGDVDGLASALKKIERYQGRFFEQIWMTGRRVPDPSLLRTHPPIEARVERLRKLAAVSTTTLPAGDSLRLPAQTFIETPMRSRPRWRVSGVWY